MRECSYCQDIKPIMDSKGFYIDLDNNNLCVAYHDKKTKTGGQWAKKIKFCPMCGRELKAGD